MHVSSEVGHGHGGCDGVEQLVRVGLLDVQESDGDNPALDFPDS